MNNFAPFACTFLYLKSRYINLQQRRIWIPSGAIKVLDVIHGDMYRPNSIVFTLLIWSSQSIICSCIRWYYKLRYQFCN